MSAMSRALARTVWTAIGGNASAADSVGFTAAGGLPSVFAVTDFASATVAVAALAVAELLGLRSGAAVPVSVDRRLASIWFGTSLRPIGWRPPAPWDPIAGDYQASDGWIRLHTNAPHHRAAAERVLGARDDRESVARALARWSKGALEAAIVEAGGCAAEMRSSDDWARHPQGSAVAAEPVAFIAAADAGPAPTWSIPAARPLHGLRVLDLTRVLAGPVASRFLAGYGADVLRIDPPGWDEPGVVPEVTLGKRCARLDLRAAKDRTMFEALLSRSDVILHGYRPGALDRLGFDAERRRSLSPCLIDVCLNAYGWSGPWANRRGFDSLVQMSTGIADAGKRWGRTEKPLPLPVQALDHATGYLMAAVTIRAITRRLTDGTGTEARLSLARTAKLLMDQPAYDAEPPLAPETDADYSAAIEMTEWGDARRVTPPINVRGATMRWDRPASSLGLAAPAWT